MKCPMTFGNPCADVDEECRADCAWLVRYGNAEACAIAKMACTGMQDHKWTPKFHGTEKGGES